MQTTQPDPNREINPGDKITLIAFHKTPGRNFDFPNPTTSEVTIRSLFIEKTGQIHYDIGFTIPIGEAPLKSLDTGEVLSNDNTYWMHSTRFTKTKN